MTFAKTAGGVLDGTRGGSRPSILVVEDDPATLALMRVALGALDLEVMEAGDGDAAIAIATERRPEIVFLDWVLPGRSGIEVCQVLRSQPETADTHIVMVSGQAHRLDFDRAREVGVDAYITKPFSPLRLVDEVEETLGIGAGALA